MARKQRRTGEYTAYFANIETAVRIAVTASGHAVPIATVLGVLRERRDLLLPPDYPVYAAMAAMVRKGLVVSLTHPLRPRHNLYTLRGLTRSRRIPPQSATAVARIAARRYAQTLKGRPFTTEALRIYGENKLGLQMPSRTIMTWTTTLSLLGGPRRADGSGTRRYAKTIRARRDLEQAVTRRARHHRACESGQRETGDTPCRGRSPPECETGPLFHLPRERTGPPMRRRTACTGADGKRGGACGDARATRHVRKPETHGRGPRNVKACVSNAEGMGS